MIRRKVLKEYIDYRYFELPKKSLGCFGYAFKFGLNNDKLSTYEPQIYLCNKTTKFDKFLAGRILSSNYVILKDEVVKNIYDDNFSGQDIKELLECFEILQNAFISVLIFPERDVSVFGESGNISEKLTNIIKKTGFDIKYFTLINTYFSYPVWSDKFRKCSVSYKQKFSIPYKKYKKMTDEEFNAEINKYMPSSASVYTKKYPLGMLSGSRATGLDRIVYCCTNCDKLFNIFSEYSQLKCSACGSAIELAETGEVLFSRNVKSLDEIKNYQLNMLANASFGNGAIFTYDEVYLCSVFYDNSTKLVGDVKLEIFKNKFKISKNGYEETFEYKDIKHAEFSFDNTLIIYLKNGKKTAICGKNNENLYVICDLIEIYNKK